MSDNEFLQNDQKPKDSIVGSQSVDETIEGKKTGFLGSLLGGKKTAKKENPVDGKVDGEETVDAENKGLNKPLLIGGGVAILGLLLGILLALTMGGDDEPVQQTQVVQEEQPAVVEQDSEMTALEANTAGTDTRDYYVAHTVRAGLPADHWAKAADPIGTLANMAVDRAMVKIPEWNVAAGGVNVASGVTYATNSFEFSQIKAQVINKLTEAINNDVQIQNDPNGQPVILERASPESIAAGGPEFDVIKTATAYDTIATNAELFAARIWSETIAQARMALPPEATAAQQVQQVDTGISAAQRNEYNRLLAEADAWQKELVRENKRIKEEMAKQQRQVTEVLQKTEDSPVANRNIRARMISTETDMKVVAIQGDLIFLEDKNGRVYSHRIGDQLPGTNFVISDVDNNTGLVYVTKK